MNNFLKFRAYNDGQILFWLYATQRCDGVCTYCKVHDLTKDNDYDLTEEDYIKIESIVKGYQKYRPEWQIPFFMISGGESLLAWNNYKSFVERNWVGNRQRQGYNDGFRMTIITNLYNLPKGFIPWLKQQSMGITPSCDGMKSKPIRNPVDPDHPIDSGPIVRNNLIKLGEWQIPYSIQSVLQDGVSPAEYVDFADFIIDECWNSHWKINIDCLLNDADIINSKWPVIKAVVDHLFKRKINLVKPQTNKFDYTNHNFTVDISGFDPINPVPPGGHCGCGHNLFGLGISHKFGNRDICLYRCNCSNEDEMALGKLSEFSKAVYNYEYGFREKAHITCKNCVLYNNCAGMCKCGETASGGYPSHLCNFIIKCVNYYRTTFGYKPFV